MDFTKQNSQERNYYSQDLSPINELISRIRIALISNNPVKTQDLKLKNIINYESGQFLYISIYQEGENRIRWGSNRLTLDDTINRDIEKIKENKNFVNFETLNPEKCRIMIEHIVSQTPISIKELQIKEFNEKRFEPGITGLKLICENNTYIYPPTDAWTKSHLDLKTVLNSLIRKTPIKKLTDKISERLKILHKSPHKLFLIKSHAFISYKNDVIPLYRGNILNTYNIEKIKEIALNSSDWIVDFQKDDGRYLYYYDAKEDNYKDHEHSARSEDNLYYNDLRHCGGIITLIRAYQATKDTKYLNSAKRAIDFIISITKEHDLQDGSKGAYVYYNNKAKLGGTGLFLTTLMRYRIETNDKFYDEYIKKYVRHLLSRITDSGEMLGYFIHPDYQNGQELISMTDEERKNTFSFYYPGEALLGLALFANYFNEDETLLSDVIEKSKIALDWIVDERPKIYADLFTALPSDGWLMQAIEQWYDNMNNLIKDNHINFVFNDADTMLDKMYHHDDSPYLDYEGGFYYDYGDHFYPDGARSEGLIAAYYLADKMGRKDLSDKYLEGCKKAALAQMYLYNSDKNTYAHKNPSKSVRGIRFKATRQWIRVDSIQHVACFYFRLYFAINHVK